MTAPYRESDPPLQYVCIVCWKTASAVEGPCCGVPRVRVENEPEVVAELRKRVKAKKARPERRRVGFVAGAAAIVAVALHAVLLGLRVYDPDPHRDSGWTGRYSGANTIAMAVFVTFLAVLVAFYYLTLWLRWFPPIEGVEKIDSETSDLSRLIAFVTEMGETPSTSRS
jgi:hypothetical protein